MCVEVKSFSLYTVYRSVSRQWFNRYIDDRSFTDANETRVALSVDVMKKITALVCYCQEFQYQRKYIIVLPGSNVLTKIEVIICTARSKRSLASWRVGEYLQLWSEKEGYF